MNKIIYTGLCALTALTFASQLEAKDKKSAPFTTQQAFSREYFQYYTGIGADGSFGSIDTGQNKLTYCQYLNEKTGNVVHFNRHAGVREICATFFQGQSLCSASDKYSLQQEKDLKNMYAHQCQQKKK